jgi:hypothetical protein
VSVEVNLTPGAVAVGLGVIVGGFLLWRASQVAARVAGTAVDAAGAAAQAVNPLNNENVFASGVNAVGGAVTGTDDWSLGVAIWEWWNPEKVAAEREVTKPAFTGGATGSW